MLLIAAALAAWYRGTRHYQIGQALDQAQHQLEPTIDALDLPVLERRAKRPTDAGCRFLQGLGGNCPETDGDGTVAVDLELPRGFTAPDDLSALTGRMESEGFRLVADACQDPTDGGRAVYVAMFEVQDGLGVQLGISESRSDTAGELTASIKAWVDHDTLEVRPPSRSYATARNKGCWTAET